MRVHRLFSWFIQWRLHCARVALERARTFREQFDDAHERFGVYAKDVAQARIVEKQAQDRVTRWLNLT